MHLLAKTYSGNFLNIISIIIFQFCFSFNFILFFFQEFV
jgi:hypothetical protein